MLLSNLLFLGALVSFFEFVRATYGSNVASRSVWLAALSPLAFFFSAAYTESLFLLLTVGAMTLAHSTRWTEAAVVAALATLTRNSGVLIFVPLLVLLIQTQGWHPRYWWTRGVQLGAAELAPVVFAVHLNRIWGDPLLTVSVQERSGRTKGGRGRLWPMPCIACTGSCRYAHLSLSTRRLPPPSRQHIKGNTDLHALRVRRGSPSRRAVAPVARRVTAPH